MTKKWTSIVDYCLHECGRLSIELDATECLGMYSCIVALKHSFQGDMHQSNENFESSMEMCWEERQLDWWSMALTGCAFTSFEMGDGWDCLDLIKDEMSRAITTRNFFIFERGSVFLLPYLWELDVEITLTGAVENEGDCYEDWVDFFVEQSSVLSSETFGDKTRRSFRYHIDSDGYLISAAGVQREIKLGYIESAAEWALELAQNCATFPQDGVENLLMSLPTYQLVDALLQLHKEQEKKLKSANNEILDTYHKGIFLYTAEVVTRTFENSLNATIAKPWAFMCRAIILKQHNKLEKCVDKLTDGLRIASHHNMQACMGFLYLNLALVEKLISANKKLVLGGAQFAKDIRSTRSEGKGNYNNIKSYNRGRSSQDSNSRHTNVQIIDDHATDR